MLHAYDMFISQLSQSLVVFFFMYMSKVRSKRHALKQRRLSICQRMPHNIKSFCFVDTVSDIKINEALYSPISLTLPVDLT